MADWQSTAQLLRIRMLADNQPNVDALDKLATALATASTRSQNGSTGLPGVSHRHQPCCMSTSWRLHIM